MGRQASVDPAACLASHCPPPHGNVSENAAFPSCTKNNNNDNLENRKDDDPEAPCGDFAVSTKAPPNQKWRQEIGLRAEPAGTCGSQTWPWRIEGRNLMVTLRKNVQE